MLRSPPCRNDLGAVAIAIGNTLCSRAASAQASVVFMVKPIEQAGGLHTVWAAMHAIPPRCATRLIAA